MVRSVRGTVSWQHTHTLAHTHAHIHAHTCTHTHTHTHTPFLRTAHDIGLNRQTDNRCRYWGVAESDDGIHFNLITLTETGDNTPTMLPEGGDRNGGSGSNSMPEYAPHHSRQTARQVMQHQGGGVVGGAIRQQALTSTLARPKDGNALLLDDDGTGYIAYTNLAPGPGKDHMVFIEELEPDLRHAANKTVFGPFPDQFVEGVMFFKRKGVYYIIYSSCCCACREGSGAVVYTAENVAGPWTKQSNDVNCNLPKISTLSLPPPVPSGDRMLAAAPEPALGRGGSSRICAGMPAPAGLPDGPRPTGHIIINAQGFSISTLMSSTGEPIFLWLGQRWMSGPNNNPNCTTLCVGATGACSQDPRYSAGNDFTYLIPLAFEPNGAIKTFAPFVDEFALDLPG